MKICRNCGTANVNSGQVCFKCNAPLGATEPAAAQTVSCRNCMAVNAVGAHYCYNCGQSLKAETHFCNSCGANNRPNDVYCSSCGRKILMDNPAPPPATAQPAAEPEKVAVEAPVSFVPALIPGTPPVQVIPDSSPYFMQPDVIKGKIVQPQSIAPAINPPQTKRQYRIQLFLMFAALCAMFYLLTQQFFVVQGFALTGLASLLVLPAKFVPDFIAMVPEFLGEHALAAEIVASGLESNFAAIFAYLLFGVLVITVVILVFYTLIALIRLIANKPYNNTRRGLFYLCLIVLSAAGLQLLAIHVEFVRNIFIGQGSAMLFEPQMFFYIFAGGLFALFILSRIARVKSPRITRRQRKKAEKKAAKKVKK